MEIVVEYCDICEKLKTDLKCEMCGKFICYGVDDCCLKSCGLYFDGEVVFGLNLCPKCHLKIKKNFNRKYGNKKDKAFLKEMETKTKEYFKQRFKVDLK